MKTNPKGYILCPRCQKATKTKVRSDTYLKNFPLYCTWCKRESIITFMPEPTSQS